MTAIRWGDEVKHVRCDQTRVAGGPSQASTRPGARLSVGRTGGAILVEVEGELASGSSAAMEHLLRDLIEDQGNMEVIIDLRKVTYADAEALTVLLAGARIARQRRAALVLRDAPEAIERAVDRLTGFKPLAEN